MTFGWEYLNGSAVQCWSLVLLHFIWQGFVIAGFVSLALRRLDATETCWRYSITLIGLMFMIVAPAVTFCLIEPPTGGTRFKPIGHEMTVPLSAIFPTDFVVGTPAGSVNEISDMRSSTTSTAWSFPAANGKTLRAVLFATWTVAQTIFATRLILGAVIIWRIRRAAERVSDQVIEMSRGLAKQLGMQRVPEILSSQMIGDAAACGLFKGVVLLPAAWLTQMSPEMLEAILAHEFSHIRRNDVWVNLLQRLVESAFFYHPAVWWVSRKLRVEREHRSDADAVRMTGKRDVFARALEQAARQGGRVRLTLATNLGDDRMSLLNRVNRVLNNQNVVAGGSRWHLGLLALVVPLLLVFSAPKSESHADEEHKPSAVPTVPQPQALDAGRLRTAAQSRHTAQRRPGNKAPAIPTYVVEPPDVLLLDAIRLVPKNTYRLGPSDALQVVSQGTGPTQRAIAGTYTVSPVGSIDLGSPYGSVTVAGLSVVEAENEIGNRLASVNSKFSAAVSLAQLGDRQRLSGEFIVGPDGEVGLGRYGHVRVAGKTLVEARREIERQLSSHFHEPKVSVDIFVYNSKFYYVILENTGTVGDSVTRIPVTGSETVLDAIAQIGGIDGARSKKIWVSRPNPGGTDQVLPVSWSEITRGASTETNYQLLPGDRVFVSDRNGNPYARRADQGVQSPARRFNQLVKAKRFQDAIDCARQLTVTNANREIVETLRRYADLLEKNLADQKHVQAQLVTDAINELRESRLAEIELRQALNTKMIAEFDNATLDDALATISKQLNVNLVLDVEGIAATGISGTTPISLHLRQPVSAKSLLQLLLEPLDLTYRIQHGVIRVTAEHTMPQAFAQAYSVSDLIGLPLKADDGAYSNVNELDYDQLILLISTTVAPNTWEKVGGQGAIAAFPRNKSLVISNSKSVHDEVKVLLEQLRRAVRESASTQFRR